jgi:hypothetical protein
MGNIELRWYKSVDDGDFILQFRERALLMWGDWKDVPFVLEGVDIPPQTLLDGTPIAP